MPNPRPDARGPRIGVFVCHCGKNIAGTVDVERVVEALARHPGSSTPPGTSTCARTPART